MGMVTIRRTLQDILILLLPGTQQNEASSALSLKRGRRCSLVWPVKYEQKGCISFLSGSLSGHSVSCRVFSCLRNHGSTLRRSFLQPGSPSVPTVTGNPCQPTWETEHEHKPCFCFYKQLRIIWGSFFSLLQHNPAYLINSEISIKERMLPKQKTNIIVSIWN